MEMKRGAGINMREVENNREGKRERQRERESHKEDG